MHPLIIYNTERSLVGRLVGLLNSPLRLNPGEFVELKTCNMLSDRMDIE